MAAESKIGSCTQVIRSNGEIFAVAHPQRKTGYKSVNSETNVRTLGSKTTYKQFYEDEVALPTVTKNPKGMSYRPKLVPYDMNSIVNQLPVRFDREPLHGVRFCAPRNISQFGLGDRPYERQYVTSNKNSFVQHHGLPVGFTNQGIMSEKTRFLHWKQSL
ncbi:hypothetical protein GUITHDRAFT_152150 [Guillardia theta CCMP2712]|uniref:Uncharacterized protein n=1 Tax=Guillardia theta (strain CCMP2712) TaxID=905079 RepID=L1JG49_GUITC|nr:hypothetical protein GUITHDRAFT_152150 [Guillardia theta CCMP2712]EKX47075.1 hypothetical protein GUITHDRAFT_152150 [Guillardia theta CCMP2712]|eukprot:XP_005834055.1 hypothetical protein GUITHDRAFT_152150 [Guillardia theta CCMP2712]